MLFNNNLAATHKYGAGGALYRWEIEDSEHPPLCIAVLHAIVANNITSADALQAYHRELQNLNIKPCRS